MIVLVHSAPDSLFNRSCARRDRMDGRVLLLSGMLPCDDTSRAPARSERGVPDHPFAAQQPCRCFPNDDDVVAPAQVSVGFPSGYFHHRDHTLTHNFAQYADCVSLCSRCSVARRAANCRDYRIGASYTQGSPPMVQNVCMPSPSIALTSVCLRDSERSVDARS